MEQMEGPTPSQGEAFSEKTAQVAPVAAEQGRSRRSTLGLIIGMIVLVALIAAAVYGMVTHPVVTTVIRDIAIIVLAFITLVTGVLLAVLIFQLQSLIALLRQEIYPILRSVNDTTSTVRGTTTFVSDAVVTPVIKAASYASGVKQTFRTLVKGSSRRKAPDRDSTNQV
jgi:hypothetical protein